MCEDTDKNKNKSRTLWYTVVIGAFFVIFAGILCWNTRPRSHEELVEIIRKCFVETTSEFYQLDSKMILTIQNGEPTIVLENDNGSKLQCTVEKKKENVLPVDKNPLAKPAVPSSATEQDVVAQIENISSSTQQPTAENTIASQEAKQEQSEATEETTGNNEVVTQVAMKQNSAPEAPKEILVERVKTYEVTFNANLHLEDVSSKGTYENISQHPIKQEDIDNAMRAVALAAHQDIKQDYDSRFSILITLLTIFGIAWPIMVAFVQHKFNERELDRIEEAVETANEASTTATAASTTATAASTKANEASDTANEVSGEAKKTQEAVGISQKHAEEAQLQAEAASNDAKKSLLMLRRMVSDLWFELANLCSDKELKNAYIANCLMYKLLYMYNDIRNTCYAEIDDIVQKFSFPEQTDQMGDSENYKCRDTLINCKIYAKHLREKIEKTDDGIIKGLIDLEDGKRIENLVERIFGRFGGSPAEKPRFIIRNTK